ncbi:hypothetical protein [Elizabethkingia miricola]|uniref:hypothetical protein n=1 Tax=Elizabethkingia miricola TaxID=172045 RepID=UPI000B35B423|nr:hypothetical protein [Elizabethkingia miricola]
MKTILFLTSLILITLSCNQKRNECGENTAFIKTNIKKDSAITLLNTVDSIMKKAIKKEISPKEVNKQIEPLMKKYEKYLSELSTQDSIEIQKYRIDQINKMIDLQLEQQK